MTLRVRDFARRDRKMKLYAKVLVTMTITMVTTVGLAGTGVVPSIDGVAISYLDRGHGQPAVVFVGGWGAEIADWDSQIEYFSENYRVVAVDLPGFGASGHDRKQWSMAAYGDDIATVMATLEIEQAVLVGHSMGAAVILEAAMKAPGRVLGLVPVDVFHDVEARLTSEEIEERVGGMMSFVENVTEEAVRELYPDDADEEVIQKALETYRTAPKVGWREVAVDFFVWRNRLTDILGSVATPIHCINSDRFETDLETARRYSPTYDASIVEGVGHAVMLEAPEVFNKILDSILADYLQRAPVAPR
jgi:pimeloyl-ACP methyl ester carboxylesterase